MLKKHVRRVLLPLLFSCFFVFSGFLSVNAYAVENFYTTILPNEVSPLNLYFSDNSSYSDADGWQGDIANMYRFSNPAKTASSMNFVLGATNAFNVVTERYDYYVTLFYTSLGASNTFNPNTFRASVLEGSSGSIVTLSNITIDPVFMRESGNVYSGNVCVGKLPDSWDGSFRGVYVGGSSGSVGSNLSVYISITQVPKDTSADIQDIVSAIQAQTNQLVGTINSSSAQIGDKIDNAATDIQQAIEDQFSGDPETEFSVDDVISQHNEKMGVLSFGSDVMLQFLDMFQSANVGTAELTLPGFNITVENVEYSVWPDYSFNFEQLNEWVPALMSVIRVMLPAFVWLMVLRYCIKVFEDNFLAK